MLKKIAVVFVFIFVVASLGSCRSKKQSCGYSKINVQEKTQEVTQNIDVACID
jgi:hypothetical protein